MKRILMTLIFILMLAVPASADWYLVCDIPTGSESGADVRVDGIVLEGLFNVSSDNTAMLLLNLTPYNEGAGHTFEARFTADNFPPGMWSPPFSPGMLEIPGLRMIQQ